MKQEAGRVKEEGSTFEKAVLSEVPEVLKLFCPPKVSDPDFNLNLNQIQRQQTVPPEASQRRYLKHQTPQPQNQIEPSEEYEYDHASASDELGVEVGGAILKNKLKKLSLDVFNIIADEGQTTKKELRRLLIHKFQTEYGTLSQKTIRNLTRRYYDVLNSLIRTSLVKELSNKRIASVENIGRQQDRTLSGLRRKIEEHEAQLNMKRQKLKLSKNAKLKMAQLNIRNRQLTENTNKIAMPLYAYLQNQNGFRQPTIQSDQLTIRKEDLEDFRTEKDLLWHLGKVRSTSRK